MKVTPLHLFATPAQFLTWYKSLELLGFWKTTPFSCSILIASLKTLWILLELESLFAFTWMRRKDRSRWWEISAQLKLPAKAPDAFKSTETLSDFVTYFSSFSNSQIIPIVYELTNISKL